MCIDLLAESLYFLLKRIPVRIVLPHSGEAQPRIIKQIARQWQINLHESTVGLERRERYLQLLDSFVLGRA